MQIEVEAQMVDKGNDQGERDLDSIPAEGSLLNTTELIEAFGREYFAAEFPNPQRVGCPSRARLSEVARAIGAPDRELQEHLFGCSDCFNEFRAAMTSPTVVREPWWKGLLTSGRRIPALAALGALAVCLAGGVFLIYQQTRRLPTQTTLGNPEGVTSRAVPSPVDDRGRKDQPNGSTAATTERKVPAKESQADLLAMVSARVDLRQRIALGSAVREAQASQSGEPIKLAAAPTRLHLTLPEGSSSGVYLISVLDRASLNPVISTRASSSNGKSVETVLSLDHLADGEYVLRVARAGESPSDFPLLIHRAERK